MSILALGRFRLDTQGDVLFRDGEPTALGRRAVALLLKLVERPGAVVVKKALIEAAWPNQAVEESNLTVQIAALRRVFGMVPGGDRWIETLPRRGYRFIGPVGTAEGDLTGMAPTPCTAVPQPRPHKPNDAEHRHLTVMVCDMIGAPRPADSATLEALHAVLRDFHCCVMEAVARHGGLVMARLGNSVTVLFGHPVAQEHDAERAVRAGLELCAVVNTRKLSIGRAIRCRVGVATGMAIVGEQVPDGTGGDREVLGDIPDLAGQLRSSAAPDTVTIDQATRAALGNLFEYRDLGPIECDDTEPVQRWQVLKESVVASRFEALRGPTLTPLVGRDEEMDLLSRRWERAKAGDGQVVLITGEPGIGKSRIVAALSERLRDEPHLRVRYFCSPYHQASALFPVIEQLARAAGFSRDDAPDARREKLEDLLVRATVPDQDIALLADLLSLPATERHTPPVISPPRKKERTLAALIHQVEGLSRQQPLVMVVEDAHWIDPTSHELLGRMIERGIGLRVLLIVTFRPDFRPSWTGESHVTTLALKRLNRRERIALVEGIAGDKPLPDGVIDQIVERADGVPLFVEELTKSILESGRLRVEDGRAVWAGALTRVSIPRSLHASLMARLDRSASARRVAQIGAAIGREFHYALLHDLCHLDEGELQAALADLVASDLVLQRGTPPDAVYAFKHVLVQDAAYTSLLGNARRRLHAEIIDALETHSLGSTDTEPEALARHYAEAGLADKSAACWARAGQNSAARSMSAEAAAQYQMALEQLGLLPDGPDRQRAELTIRAALGAVLHAVKGFAAPETGDNYSRAGALWKQLGSPSDFLRIPFGQSEYHLNRGELDLALGLARNLLDLSRQRGDAAGLVLGNYASGLNLMATGQFAEARMHLEEGLASYDPAAHRLLVHQAGVHPHVNLQAVLGHALFCLGYPDQAVAQSRAAIAEARRLAHPPSLSASLSLGSRVHSLAGDRSFLNEWASQLVAVATDQGFPRWRALGAIYGGWARVGRGEVSEGISLLSSGLAAFRRTGDAMWMPHYIALLARSHEIAGQMDDALTLLEEAFQFVANTGERWFAAELDRYKGQLLERRGDTHAAEDLYRKALRIAREQGAKLWELRAVVSLAHLLRDQGRHTEASNFLVPVYSWFNEGFATPDLREAKELLDKLAHEGVPDPHVREKQENSVAVPGDRKARRTKAQLPLREDAKEATIYGWAWFCREWSHVDLQRAQMHFERALENDPDCIDAKIGAALACVIGILEGWSSSLSADQHLAEVLLTEALECEPNHSMAHHAMGMLRRSQKRLPDARESLGRAVALDPDDAGAVHQLGLALLYEGQPEAAIQHIKKAIRISPRDRLLSSMYYGLGRCHLFLLRSDMALQCFDRTIAIRPKYWDALVWRAGALGLAGDLARARAEYSAARLLIPEIDSLARWRAYQPWITYPKYEALRDKTLYAGLRAAGMPDE